MTHPAVSPRLRWAAALITACILLAGQAPGALAHSLYIQSTRYFADEGKALPLFFCYGHYVPVADGVRGKKLKAVRVIDPDGKASPIAVRDEKSLHSYMVEYSRPGTWTLTAETTPGYYTVYIDKKGRERHTIKPMAKIKDQAQKVLKSYFAKQFAKTYVTCETPSKPFPAKAGLALELVPAQDPATLKPGEALELNVFLNGTPYQGKGTWDATFSGFSTRPEDNFHPKTEVKGSRILVPVPHTGRWFVRYFIKTDAPKADQDKYMTLKMTATLTFQLDNDRKRPKSSGH